MKYEFHPAALQEYAEAVAILCPTRQTPGFYRHDRKRHI